MEELKGKRVLLYMRVSTEEQARNGESIVDQRQALRSWAKKHGCVVVQEFVDEGFSARKSYKSRPALCSLLGAVERQETDAVVFTKLDRWFRNVRDYNKVQEVLDRSGVFWMATLEDYETKTSAGRFKVNLMLSLAEHEADQTSERIKFTFQQKRERGEIVSGNMPKGYKLENGKPVKDPETERGISAFWREYLSTGKMYVALDRAAENGVPLAVSSASFMLRNAAHYAGQIQGCPCEPYITEEERDLVLATRKAPNKRSGRVYLFSGLIYCAECGGRMGAHRHFYKKSGGRKGEQVYYNCTRHYRTRPAECPSKVNIYERDIESDLLNRIEGAVEESAVKADTAIKEAEKNGYADTESKIKRLEKKKGRLIDAYLDGLIEKEELKKRQADIEEEVDRLKKSCIPDIKKSPEAIRAMLPDGWKTVYDGMNLAHKRAFWYSVLDRVEVTIDRKIVFSLH